MICEIWIKEEKTGFVGYIKSDEEEMRETMEIQGS